MLKTLLLALVILLPPISASPDEAMGIVTQVIDGDTIEVQGVGRIRLADVDCPEASRPGGLEAT